MIGEREREREREQWVWKCVSLFCWLIKALILALTTLCGCMPISLCSMLDYPLCSFSYTWWSYKKEICIHFVPWWFLHFQILSITYSLHVTFTLWMKCFFHYLSTFQLFFPLPPLLSTCLHINPCSIGKISVWSLIMCHNWLITATVITTPVLFLLLLSIAVTIEGSWDLWFMDFAFCNARVRSVFL